MSREVESAARAEPLAEERGAASSPTNARNIRAFYDKKLSAIGASNVASGSGTAGPSSPVTEVADPDSSQPETNGQADSKPDQRTATPAATSAFAQSKDLKKESSEEFVEVALDVPEVENGATVAGNATVPKSRTILSLFSQPSDATDAGTACCICLEDLHSCDKAINTLKCGHKLHEECFHDYKVRSVLQCYQANKPPQVLCPLCRQNTGSVSLRLKSSELEMMGLAVNIMAPERSRSIPHSVLVVEGFRVSPTPEEARRIRTLATVRFFACWLCLLLLILPIFGRMWVS